MRCAIVEIVIELDVVAVVVIVVQAVGGGGWLVVLGHWMLQNCIQVASTGRDGWLGTLDIVLLDGGAVVLRWRRWWGFLGRGWESRGWWLFDDCGLDAELQFSFSRTVQLFVDRWVLAVQDDVGRGTVGIALQSQVGVGGDVQNLAELETTTQARASHQYHQTYNNR